MAKYGGHFTFIKHYFSLERIVSSGTRYTVD